MSNYDKIELIQEKLDNINRKIKNYKQLNNNNLLINKKIYKESSINAMNKNVDLLLNKSNELKQIDID